ncbi:hypothetical protein PERMA_A0057 (plasmid) [Persephonella marina EX-H1]|uniref:Uncharacterized protein n=1 Tax=Persephonella marina (strain DSM 14350 / EX-H1) TaxID=123214 RepID=C0QUY6_PERMH|nr:hypothetical protein [Persephonella marina]ACO04966.1 hypothetical protein PERMA_A0057 [Persephonella marina EX-H1]
MKRYILSCLAIFSIATASELGITEKDCDRLMAQLKGCVIDLYHKKGIPVDEAIRTCGQIQAKGLCEQKGIDFGKCVGVYSMEMANSCADNLMKVKLELKEQLYRN